MYEKQTWTTGEVITAEKLNHMEDGIGGGLLIVHADENGRLDKTWEEIHNADVAYIVYTEGLAKIVEYVNETGYNRNDSFYYVSAFIASVPTAHDFITNNEDGYPEVESIIPVVT